MPAATKEEIREWLEEAKEEGYTYVLIICDTFDYDDYPVKIPCTSDLKRRMKEYMNKNMQRVEEVYDLSLPLEDQLNEERAWHIGE